MPIYAFTGGLGSGKTLLMSLFAMLMHQAAGLPAYANYGLKFARRVETYGELFNLGYAVVALDEAHVLIDSRMFSKSHVIAFTQWALQTRKAGLVVLMTTQSIHQIDKRVRGIIDRLYICKRYGRLGQLRTRYTVCDPVDHDTLWLPRGSKSFAHMPFMYAAYDTLERAGGPGAGAAGAGA
jgi:hypothetical protein